MEDKGLLWPEQLIEIRCEVEYFKSIQLKHLKCLV